MAAASGAQTLILFVAMTLVTIWFTNVILKALDIVYQPKVKKWLGNRPAFGLDENEQFCSVEAPGCNEHATSNAHSSDYMTDEAIRQLEEELMVLKSLRGNAIKSEKKNKKVGRPTNDGEDDLPELASIKRRPSSKNYEGYIPNSDTALNRDELSPDELYILDEYERSQGVTQSPEPDTGRAPRRRPLASSRLSQ